ncbi:VirB8/TrbF family protein [Paraburkholderia mimosarum]|uniref:VirB8/TrbF family protein n=1 Tax=Paraburkholderia mimosarum TaxID=312026 RepID=UPI000429CAC7|nr:VirB8/TrbF family protein [Paraburkholderia mimosarum]
MTREPARGDWLHQDAPFESIPTNPKLVREVTVSRVSVLDDSTVVVEFSTSTTQFASEKPVVQRYALTLRYRILPTSSDEAEGTNPFGICSSLSRKCYDDPGPPRRSWLRSPAQSLSPVPPSARRGPPSTAAALDVSIMGDPMSPGNQYISGTDPVTMPQRRAHRRVQRKRVMTAALL